MIWKPRIKKGWREGREGGRVSEGVLVVVVRHAVHRAHHACRGGGREGG